MYFDNKPEMKFNTFLIFEDISYAWKDYIQQIRYDGIINSAIKQHNANVKNYETMEMRKTRKYVDIPPITKTSEEKASDMAKFNEVMDRLEKRRHRPRKHQNALAALA